MQKPLHELCPTTRRPGWLVSLKYGHTPRDLAQSLPEDAVVVDFGAGKSRFGESIAKKRPDVTWINADLRYGHQRTIPKRQQSSPENVHYVAADVLEPPFAAGSIHRIYSSALWPHLSMTSTEVAAEAFRQAADLLADDGEIAVTNIGLPLPHLNKTLKVTAADYHADPDVVASMVAKEMRLGPVSRVNVVSRYVLQTIGSAVDPRTSH